MIRFKNVVTRTCSYFGDYFTYLSNILLFYLYYYDLYEPFVVHTSFYLSVLVWKYNFPLNIKTSKQRNACKINVCRIFTQSVWAICHFFTCKINLHVKYDAKFELSIHFIVWHSFWFWITPYKTMICLIWKNSLNNELTSLSSP